MPGTDAAVPLPPMLVVLSGPSGAGKDSVLTYLRQVVAGLCVAVTATTRAPRPGEIPGQSYHFLSDAEYSRLLDDGKLLAAAQVHGNWYGVPVDEIRRPLWAGEDVILKLDVQGALDIKQRIPQAVFIFLAPPSLHDLVRRLEERHTESSTELERRIRNASFEMDQLPEYDYAVVNGSSGARHAAEQVASIITAERLRVHRAPVQLPDD